jgi:RNA polymerase sigma-70 factor (ECF subfamily)
MSVPRPTPELLRAAVDGDDAAWSAVVEMTIPLAIGWVRRLGGPDIPAEDVAQEVVIKVLEKLHELRDPQAFPAWLWQVCRSEVRRAHRRTRVQRLFTSLTELLPGSTGGHADISAGAAMLRLLQQLSEEQREVVVLCHVEEHTCSEAAAVLGISVGTVKSRLRLATGRLHRLAREAGILDELVGAT